MGLCVAGLGLLLCCLPASSQKLDLSGRNVCQDSRGSAPVCCPGWRQQGKECPIPVCEGERACGQDEICVHPGFCRCKPGFFGALCKTRCPAEFWGPDCRKLCQCHPHGRCDPQTGECTCLPNRWGPACQNVCKCGRHGHCDPLHGNCTCDKGWWTATCSRACQCHPETSTCDPETGRCACEPGYWGQKCSLRCGCYISPCQQMSGSCQCLRGWWGPTCDRRCNCNLAHGDCDPVTGTCLCQPGYKSPFCNEPCSAGHYGDGCEKRCGRCKEGQPCSVVDGFCVACEPGWNGTRCDQTCPRGYYGNLCKEVCPHCRAGEPCDPETGVCTHCDPGWTGPRCDERCAEGLFGDACRFLCGPCFRGQCDHVTGSCVCQPGFEGESCNSTCPDHTFGVNCSSSCDCGERGCDPATGVCHYGSRGVLIAGLLVPLILLLLGLTCCCFCCGSGTDDGKDRVAVEDGGPAVRMKHHVYNALANMSSAVPCLTLGSSGLPRVTVSHHDPELTFNHSFIEPPSSGWVTDNSSFESDEGEAVYCVPPREDIPALAGGDFQEISSKCNIFPDPSGFNSDDVSQPFAIPRTSSIAKSKRPSVSFAEGTKFAPKERRGSTQEVPSTARKAKSPWGVLMLSALQGQGGRGEGEGGTEGEGGVEEEPGGHGETGEEDSERHGAAAPRSSLSLPAGRRRTMSNARRAAQAASTDTQAPEAEKAVTVYVTVGRAGRPARPESGGEGPVQAVLRRLGSLQKRSEEGGHARGGIAKPPRRKLGARVSAWEQAAAGGAADGARVEVHMRKPSRRKPPPLSSPGSLGDSASWQDGGSPPRRPLSSILKSVPENAAAGAEASTGATDVTAAAGCRSGSQVESGYLSVGDGGEVITNQGVVASADEGPAYENILITPS
ncbi:scavenger receptor class F member 1 [Megalops cyprinoides]|uniref:scavenger receptor class F member 1 n=1 Tax=Megalops cyprinoides TaxID=118141 RepID=UPI0018640A2E|nr:scavenger receptor class F member 1 [Megalops cyprinoides]